MMFHVIYRNKTYQVDKGWYKVIILRNQHLVVEKEKSPELIVFIGERDDNPGMSVTNAIENIAGKIWNDLINDQAIKPDDIVWVECYPEEDPPTVDTVTFLHRLGDHGGMQFTRPQWKRIILPMPAKWTGGAV